MSHHHRGPEDSHIKIRSLAEQTLSIVLAFLVEVVERWPREQPILFDPSPGPAADVGSAHVEQPLESGQGACEEEDIPGTIDNRGLERPR